MTRRLAQWVTSWPRSTVATAAVLAILGAWLGMFHLALDSDTDSLIAPERPFMQEYRAWQKEFGDLEGVVIAVDAKGDTPDRTKAAEAAVDALAAKLEVLDEKFVRSWSAWIAPDEQWRLASWAASDAELKAMAAEADAIADVARGNVAAHPVVVAALSATRPREYLRAPGGKLLFVEAMPVKDFSLLDPVGEPIAAIRAAVDAVRAEHPTVEIGVTGKPVLQHDEMATANRDMAVASAISLAIITVLFIAVFRGVRRPLLAVLAFAIATGWTYGAATLLVGHLNLLSTVFMLVLVGAGLDYGVHVVSRYGEFRKTHDAREATALAIRHVGPGTLAGAAGSAAVFLGAIFTDFGGLRELGVIAGAGLILCALAMVTVLPALLVLLDGGEASKPTTAATVVAEPDPAAGKERAPFRVQIATACVPIIACLLFIPAGLRFESNLLELQSPQLESVQWERRIFADSASASWFAASQATTIDEVAAFHARAKDRPEILRTESILDVIPRETAERAALRAKVAGAGADLGDQMPSPDAPAAVRAAWLIWQGASLPMRDVLPEAIAPRTISPNGVFMVRYLPKEDAWEEEPLARFVDAVRAVDPSATGVPVTQLESIRDMRDAFIETSLWAVIAVTIIAAISFRALMPALLATATVVAGVGMTIGLLPILGSHLNLANFFAIPMLVGLGIDSAIHIIHRYRDDPGDAAPTIRAVAFTALTTAIGFGALVFAEHRGMRSLGIAMAVGSVACMYVACIVLTTILEWSRRRRAARA
ncbi:MAG: MMPL family transporter [Planctomycetaceae bacterium]|nr:MMPL family transporter [Planctomycetaceae bacterium]